MSRVIYTYDGSLEGYFTVVFRAFQDKQEPEAILSRNRQLQMPIGELIHVDTNPLEADRVRRGIVKHSDERNARLLHVAFLSEQPETDMLLWRYLCKLFEAPAGHFFKNMLDADVYELVQTARRVRREVHRFHGFVRFQKTADNMYVAAIDPDHDIVKLLGPHFKSRFPERHWLIYDLRRNRGIYFDTREIRAVEMQNPAFDLTKGTLHQHARAMDEDYYVTLWQHYYDAINIMERKNHRQMRASMPRRYWKYMPEKRSGYK